MKKSKKIKKSKNSNQKGHKNMTNNTISFKHITSEKFATIMKAIEINLEKSYTNIDTSLRNYNHEYLKHKATLPTCEFFEYVCETIDNITDEMNEAYSELDKAIQTLNAAGEHLTGSNYYIAYYYMYLEGMEQRLKALTNILKIYNDFKVKAEAYLENYKANIHKGGCN